MTETAERKLPTLESLQGHFGALYGRRNRIFLPSRMDRIHYLAIAIGSLSDAIRKGASMESIGSSLARVVARVFFIADTFAPYSLASAMARKYPLSRCSYCGHTPCDCPERRPSPTVLDVPHPDQLRWTLNEWCSHFERVYGERNRQRGSDNLLNRLSKEVVELISLDYAVSQHPGPLSTIEDEYGFELSDAFAWTIGLANVQGVDLGAAVARRYSDGCWNCMQLPCQCTTISFAPIAWGAEGGR